MWSSGTFVPLPPPEQEELEAVLKRLLQPCSWKERGKLVALGQGRVHHLVRQLLLEFVRHLASTRGLRRLRRLTVFQHDIEPGKVGHGATTFLVVDEQLGHMQVRRHFAQRQRPERSRSRSTSSRWRRESSTPKISTTLSEIR